MTEYDVKRFGLILAIQSEIEGMKADNTIKLIEYETHTFGIEDFNKKAEELRNISCVHDHQL